MDENNAMSRIFQKVHMRFVKKVYLIKIEKRLDDQANSLVLLMGEINKLKSEVAVLKKQLQDSNSDNSSSENED